MIIDLTILEEESKMRRSNGTGTIYKRKDAKRRNPYCVYLDGGKDDFGKRIRTFLGSFHTYKEAQNALEQYRQGTYIKPSSETTLKEVWNLLYDLFFVRMC